MTAHSELSLGENMSDTLDLAILNAGPKRAAIALARYGSDVAIASLPSGKELRALADFRDRINQVLLLNQKRPTSIELSTFGKNLFSYIIRDDVKRLYDRFPSDPLIP